jgi:UDP-N-acetylmuramate--alanine ligase
MKNIHFIGIGGVSMSGIAKVLKNRGFIVSGSDSSQSYLTEKLKSYGISVFYGHAASNIPNNVDLVVKTSTVNDTNPELIEAKERKIKIVERYEMLNLLSQFYKINLGVAGSHGKTTSTSYLWKIINKLSNKTNFKPSLFLGSIIYDEQIEGNCFEQEDISKITIDNQNSVAVYETDESDRSFEKMNLDHAIITNIDNDHLEFYSNSFFNLYEAFVKFGEQIIKKNGFLVIGLDFEYSKKLYQNLKTNYPNANIVSYSLSDSSADFYSQNIKDDGINTIFDLYSNGVKIIEGFKIPSIGSHNVFNATGAIALCLKLFFNNKSCIDNNVFSGLKGIDKRFMPVGLVKSKNLQIDIVDDYAHHPTEINTIIEAVNNSKRWDNFLLVFEPHKYTRVASIYKDFLISFTKAKDVMVMDIFGVSGGLKIDITKDKFVNDITQKSPGVNIIISKSNDQILEDVYNFVNQKYKSGRTIILFIGAGLSSYFAKKAQNFFETHSKK